MMFTVKLASSETFNVTAAEQSYSAADYTGRLCVIGSELKEDQLETLFLLA